ncbi:lemA family protein [Fusobacterium sp. CAG:439]|nr:lemA family protein [Fusobacterium sp. CAG:439]HIT92860.1 LemA family protein [Candidatus Stercorousia faecigallinarum]
MKNTGLIILGVLILAIIAIAGFFIGTYNKLQVMDENVTANWAQVENQLKRRNDLIPNLVNTVKGYAKHENEIFTNIANARAKLSGAMNTNDVKAVQQSTNELNSALSRLLVVVENYPNLKADKAFTGLQDELAGTENRLAVARRDYNESVKTINTIIRTFPTSLVAAMSGVKSRDYFEITEQEKQTPKVEF